MNIKSINELGISPAPWTAGTDINHMIHGVTGEIVANAWALDRADNEAVETANAKLIAAAPAMYQALYDLCDECANVPGGRCDMGGDCDTCPIRAALKAAGGESGRRRKRGARDEGTDYGFSLTAKAKLNRKEQGK